ncbi:MAG: cytochrome b N-terminal domain-containing protein [Patescibacteria group bacterium]|nr:cytochrome b N-terminal domain-containing protein [Patescibacteria group bacterium]
MKNKITSSLSQFLKNTLFITKVPPYGNSIFYSLGFLGLTCFAVLVVTGTLMAMMGTVWWLRNPVGMFMRSVHLWSTQMFVAIIVLHGLVVFTTSAFKPPRRLTWIIGAVVFLFLLLETEFGYYLRGDFSSQYRALQGADFWNGAYLGRLINTLSHSQVYGIHVIIFPAIIFVLVAVHYALVKIRGIAKPYRATEKINLVPASHRRLFVRGGVLVALAVVLALVFPSPLMEPVSIQGLATHEPVLVAQTLVDEYSQKSDTATYLDSIDPYSYDTKDIYVAKPYAAYVASIHGVDEWKIFQQQPAETQQRQVDAVNTYLQTLDSASQLPKVGTTDARQPFFFVIYSLVAMAQNGSYQKFVDGLNPNATPTYSLRFLSDTGALEDEASQLHITTEQWGMIREAGNKIPPGAWWLAPLGLLNHTVLANDARGDRDGAEILGLLMLILILFPYIPYLNRLPEKLHIAQWIWKAK